MDVLDTLLLSRIQFAANISFHILFPTITIALGWVLFFFRLRYAMTGREAWMDSYRFWVKIFALSFAMGVVSGITMSFQFGTNWPGFMEKVGNVAGPLLAYEVLTAFFLEAVFLGIMLFGASKEPNWLHTLATFLVAFGTLMSAFWILVLNSWMHTPQGFEMIDGVAHATRGEKWSIGQNAGNSAPDRAVPASGDRSQKTGRAPDFGGLRCYSGRWRDADSLHHRRVDRYGAVLRLGCRTRDHYAITNH